MQTAFQTRCLANAPHPVRKARQASSWRSPDQPGTSAQAARTQAGAGVTGGGSPGLSQTQGAQVLATGAQAATAGADCVVGGGGGGSAQPAASSVAARMEVKRKAQRIVFADGSWILLLEAALALGLAVFIVWYTLPAKKKPADKTPAKDVTRKP